jgi:hypothetical protein
MRPKLTLVHRFIEFVERSDADLYATLALALLLTVVQLWAKEWTNALFAGTLTTIALSLMRLRRDVGILRQGESFGKGE